MESTVKYKLNGIPLVHCEIQVDIDVVKKSVEILNKIYKCSTENKSQGFRFSLMLSRLACRNCYRVGVLRSFQANPRRSEVPRAREIKPERGFLGIENSRLAGLKARGKLVKEQGKKYGWSFIFLRLVVNCLSLLPGFYINFFVQRGGYNRVQDIRSGKTVGVFGCFWPILATTGLYRDQNIN